MRRYEHPHSGSPIHVDVTKFDNIPDDGGHRFVGRQLGKQNRHQTARRTGDRNELWQPRVGTAYVHTDIDDHSRITYAEICTDERATTAIGVLQRAVAWFAEHGVTVERVLSDTARRRSPTPGVTPARSSRSSTAGPAIPAADEREDREIPPTLADDWAYARL